MEKTLPGKISHDPKGNRLCRLGEAAQCFAAHLAAKGLPEPLVFCEGPTNHPPYTDAFRAMAATHRVTLVDTLDALMARADIVFRGRGGDRRRGGQAIAARIRPGTLVIDVNASTRRTKRWSRRP